MLNSQPFLTDPDDRRRFEALVADLAAEFVNMPAEHVLQVDVMTNVAVR